MIKIFQRGLAFLILFLCCSCSVFSVQQGQVQYEVPIDYSYINEGTLNLEAENLFNAYMTAQDETQKKKLLEQMLSDYSVLSKINSENPLYFTRLGIIFDKLGKDRWAKSNFCRSSNMVPDNPYAFYNYGNYFFDRAEYRKALREYMRAYNCGYNTHYETLYQIGRIYEKYGDFTSAIGFYKRASQYKPSSELSTKILMLEELKKKNSLYDEKRRLH